MKKTKAIKKKGDAKSKSISNAKKERPKHGLSTKKTNSRYSSNTDKALIENFILLQKVMTNLSLKFDNLSSQISKLLELFEITAKTIAKREYEPEENKNNQELIKKLDNLAEQNKTIARGLTLMHDLNSQKRPPSSPEFSGQRTHIEEGRSKKLNSPEYGEKI